MDWFKTRIFFFFFFLYVTQILNLIVTNVFSPQALSANQVKSEIMYTENQKQNNFTELGQNAGLDHLIHTHLL